MSKGSRVSKEVAIPVNASSVALLAALEEVGGVIDNGLILPPDLSYDRYEAIGALLRNLDSMLNWLIGDWLIYGEHTYGVKFHQAAEVTGKHPQTLLNIQNVARKIPPSRRVATVDFWHHYEVRSVPPAEQKALLKRAHDERLTKAQMRDLAKLARGEELPSLEIQPSECCPQCGRPL